MYYGLLTLSVILFGIQFLFNKQYQQQSGSGIGATFIFTFLSSLVGAVCLLIINQFRLGFTPFTLLMATLAAINSILYSFCSLKAFEHINLSLYSLFAMLGGMLLPFFVGIVFYDEPITYANIICVIFIGVALFFTFEKGEKKKGYLYYAGVFVLNGMSGVLSKMFQSIQAEKSDSASYSIWIALNTMIISGIILLIIRKKLEKPNKKAVLYTAGYGSINTVANYMLLLALAVLPASVQYPFVTGGVMIVSTVISILCKQTPSKKEIAAVALSFVGVLVLVIL